MIGPNANDAFASPFAAAKMPRPGGLMIMASLIINLLALALPAVILQVYDRVLVNQSQSTLLLLGIGLVGVLIIDAALRFGRSYLATWEAARYEHRLNCTAVDHFLASSLCEVERDAPGVHLDRFNAIATLRGFYAGQGRMVFLDMPFIVLFLGLIWLIGGPLVAAPVVLFAALAVVSARVGMLLRRALRDRAGIDDRRQSFIIEVLNGIHTIKGMAMEGLMQRRYERLQQASAASTYRATFVSNLAQSMSAVFAGMTIALVAGGGAILVIRGSLTLGELSACTLLASRALQPLLRALGLWAQFQGHAIARECVHNLLAMAPENAADAAPVPDLTDSIEFRDVAFTYGTGAPAIFTGLDLTIKQGDFVAITGPTGSGKTTLLSMLGGLLVPSSGVLAYDGKDVTTLDRSSLRRHLVYVPQQPTLFQGTILDNLALFQGTGGIGRAMNAARRLGVDQAISRLPDGYNTRIGDGAQEELPTGIKQSIATARALALNPRVLLFDEANCSLDPAAEGDLKEALASLRGAVTVVLTSHRPSLLAEADRTYTIDCGNLVLTQVRGVAQATGKTIPAVVQPVERHARKIS